MKRGSVQQKDGHWPRSARRSVGHRLQVLAIQVPVSHRVKFLLLGLPILFLLISSFFVGSPFASVDLNLRTSASDCSFRYYELRVHLHILALDIFQTAKDNIDR